MKKLIITFFVFFLFSCNNENIKIGDKVIYSDFEQIFKCIDINKKTKTATLAFSSNNLILGTNFNLNKVKRLKHL